MHCETILIGVVGFLCLLVMYMYQLTFNTLIVIDVVILFEFFF